jgi:hypothetical protein
MTEPEKSLPLDECIDRIVDGGLTPAELRAAVIRLDRDPAGWKRCGVAFLEAQCWRESMRFGDEPARAEAGNSSLTRAAAPQKARRPWLRHAVAAGVVGASFALGWVGHAIRPATTTGGAIVTGPSPALVQRETENDRPAGLPADDGQNARSAIEPRPRSNNEPGGNPAPLVAAVGRLNIGSQDSHAEVPILAGPGIDEEWLKRQPPPVSEYGQVVFQRHGYQVDQRRQLITTVTADGRRIAVPVNQVLIRYTGNQPL